MRISRKFFHKSSKFHTAALCVVMFMLFYSKDAHHRCSNPLQRIYVVSNPDHIKRRAHMAALFNQVRWHKCDPRPTYIDAVVPTGKFDSCLQPYSLDDCCTVSHMAALKDFSSSVNVYAAEWAIILEDDVMIHPQIGPTSIMKVANTAIHEAEAHGYEFLYLGICSEVDLQHVCGGKALALCPSLMSRGCTHAYAVRSSLAARLPFMVRSTKADTIDSAFQTLANTRQLAMPIAGAHLRSPDNPGHFGLFYQANKLAAGSLTNYNSQPQERPMVHFTVALTGRIGNLMFGWASVWGLATQYNTSTVWFSPTALRNDNLETPIRTFFANHRLQRFASVREVFPPRECYFHVKEAAATLADKQLYAQIEHAQQTGKGCPVVFIVLHGYLQSWRYFEHPRAKSLVHRSLETPPYYSLVADEFFSRAAGANIRYIGVQMRLGDKVNSDIFPPGFDEDYYRNGIDILKKKLQGMYPSTQLKLVVTAGGSMTAGGTDISEAKKLFKQLHNGSLFTDSTDPYADMAILRRCDGLVIGTSSFGWWAAYLSGLPGDRIVAPQTIIRPTHQLAAGFRQDDYYPSGWTLLKNWKNITHGVK